MSGIGCCTGTIDTGEPVGKVQLIHGMECYVTGKDSTTALIIATDVYGFTVPNVRLIADEYAKRLNCIVYIPDYFDGNYMSNDAILPDDPNASLFQKATGMIKAMYQFPWFLWTNRIEVGINKIRDFVENIRKEKERIFMQGYCWGGTVVLQLASEGIADGICCAHPGQVNLELTIKTPILFAFAESDIFLASDIAEKVDKNVKKNAKVLVKQYAGTIHGFAVRGNSADEVVRNQRKQVLQDAIEFFESLL